MEPLQTNDRDRWQAAKRIFRACVDLKSKEWPVFLDRECADDEPLRRLVETLLASDRRAANPEQDPLPSLFTASGPVWPVPPIAGETRLREDREPQVGQVISHYLLLERLGAGGMGVVFHARDIRLERDVALKFLPPYLQEDTVALRGLIAEAQAVAALNDPRISTLFEVGGVESGNLFIVETFWAGETLDKRLSRGPLPTAEALRIAAEIARGLETVHAQGIFHRDIKPGNILLTHEGQVKILDFGIAQTGSATNRQWSEPTAGTQGYMSPEQVRGEEVDARTDIWALGTVLYLMLTGKLPFPGRSREDVTHAILNRDPEPISTHLPECSKRLRWLLSTALRKNRKARFAGTREFLEAIQKVRAEIGVAANPAVPFRTTRSSPGLRPVTFAVGAVVLAALLLGAWVTRTVDQDPGTTARHEIHSIAVLPFANLSKSADEEPFVEGLTETLIDNLGRIRDLRVMSRTSSMSYRDSEKTLTEIAHELQVEAVVEGSVLVDGDRTLIIVRLIEIDPERLMWTRSYSRDRQERVALQQELALSIAAEVHVAISPEEEHRLRETQRIDPRAQDLYIKARHLSRLGYTPARAVKALEILQEALTLEPGFAKALAELANLYPILAHYTGMAPDEAYPLGRAAALAALDQDPSLVSAHLALMRSHLTYDWDWPGARRTILRGLKSRPDSGSLHRGYAWYLATTGQIDSALIEIETAGRLDPASEAIAVDRARFLVYAGRYREAVGRTLEVLEIWPDSVGALRFRGLAQARLGEVEAGLDSLQRAAELRAPRPLLLGELGAAQAMSGATADALETLSTLLSMKPTPSYNLAVVHAGLGHPEQALDWLERAYREHSILISRLKVDPCLKPLREAPRFEALLSQLGLADDQIAATDRADPGRLALPQQPRDSPWSQSSSTTSRIR